MTIPGFISEKRKKKIDFAKTKVKVRWCLLLLFSGNIFFFYFGFLKEKNLLPKNESKKKWFSHQFWLDRICSDFPDAENQERSCGGHDFR